MLIRSVKVRNIRSHRFTELKFNPGVTVLSGDIGSGKTSMLYAIDFALFGLRPGELSGEELLRATENKGMVEVEVDIGGRTYVIGRSLERLGDSVRVGKAWIIYPGGKRKEYSSSEARAVIVKLLGIPEEAKPTTHTRIFRTALYIPQNELTRILESRDVERREETIMRLFDLDKYRIAKENLSELVRELRRDRKLIVAKLESLGDVEKGLEEVKSRISRLRLEVEDAKTKYENILSRIENLKKERENLDKKIVELSDKYSEISRLAEKLKNLNTEHSNLKREIVEVSKQLGLEFERLDERVVEKHILEEQDRIAKLNDELEELTSEISRKTRDIKLLEDEVKRLKLRVGEIEGRRQEILRTAKEARDKLGSEMVCPLCKQPITREHLERIEEEALEKANNLELERTKLEEEISKVEGEKKRLEERVAKLQEETAQLQSEISDGKMKILKLERILRDVEKFERLSGEIENVKNKVSSLGFEVRDLKHLEESIENLKLEIDRLRAEKKSLESEESRLNVEASNIKAKLEADTREIEILESELENLKSKLRERDALRAKLEKVDSTISWIEDRFSKALEVVEREASSRVYYAFATIFKQLVEELLGESGVRVEVDDKYTPIVFQEFEGREARLQLENLSGGEAASIALAYRLALNYVARYRIPSLREGTLLLDEPSTGFSREQLRKFRDVISRVGARQVIIVTHEDILEDAADHIVRLVKRGGVSRVEKVYSLGYPE